MIKGIQGYGYYDELVVPIIENTAHEVIFAFFVPVRLPLLVNLSVFIYLFITIFTYCNPLS